MIFIFQIRQLESQLLSRPTQYTPNISPQPTMMVQPETDPYARPSPPYLFQSSVNAGNFFFSFSCLQNKLAFQYNIKQVIFRALKTLTFFCDLILS